MALAFIAELFSELTKENVMRKFQELYLKDVVVDQRFWVDGAQYKRIDRTLCTCQR